MRANVNLVDCQEEGMSKVLYDLKLLKEKKVHTYKQLHNASELLMSFDQWQVTLSPPMETFSSWEVQCIT